MLQMIYTNFSRFYATAQNSSSGLFISAVLNQLCHNYLKNVSANTQLQVFPSSPDVCESKLLLAMFWHLRFLTRFAILNRAGECDKWSTIINEHYITHYIIFNATKQ